MLDESQLGSSAPERPTANESPDDWGNWIGRKHFSLDVVQHPLRARMCGFGDKDRRPLAPAAVAKMIVKGENNDFVDIDDVDCSFFLVTADLWSADGKREMNLVLHPSSAERYVTPHSVFKPPTSGHGEQSPASDPTTVHLPPRGYISHGHCSPHQTPRAGDLYSSGSLSASSEPTYIQVHPPPPLPLANRSLSYPPQILQSIQSLGRSSAPVSEHWQNKQDLEPLSYRSSDTDTVNHTIVTPAAQIDSTMRNNSPGEAELHASSLYGSSSSPQLQPSRYQVTSTYASRISMEHTPLSPVIPLPRHTYIRTLIGPLSTNACRLLDENRNPGIFFLFQDLSVRTEGVFRLRLRLLNIGAPPAPEAGAVRVHNNVSPVLAQIFTEPFTVYSAKRFPGVPDTTALSIALGNQGQKLSLRNRHGSKRRQRDDSGSDDDSD